MIRYAILDAAGLIIGVGDAQTEVEGRASAEPFGTYHELADGADALPGQHAIADGRIVPVDKPSSPETAMTGLRLERNALLSASDWTQMPDADLTDEQRAAWRFYRQALRDMPKTTEDPASAVWPEMPT